LLFLTTTRVSVFAFSTLMPFLPKLKMSVPTIFTLRAGGSGSRGTPPQPLTLSPRSRTRSVAAALTVIPLLTLVRTPPSHVPRRSIVSDLLIVMAPKRRRRCR
jgi:hypothetical protein